MKKIYKKNSSLLITGAVLTAAGLTWWIIDVVSGERTIWLAILVNFLFFLSTAAGMCMWPILLNLVEARWANAIEHRSIAALGFAVPSLFLLGGLWVGSSIRDHWAGKQFSNGVYLNTTFLFARDLFIITLFWLLCYVFIRLKGSLKSRLLPGFTVLCFVTGFTFLSIDLVEALKFPWKSALFGPYFFVNALYAGVTAWTLSVITIAEKQTLHTLASLIIATSLMTTYAFFCQLLTIWYENIPDETLFIIPRFNYNWKYLSLFVIILLYVSPLMLLLLNWCRQTRWYLGTVCIVLLLSQWIEVWWWIVPGITGNHMNWSFSCLAAFIFTGGLFLFSYRIALNRIKKTYYKESV